MDSKELQLKLEREVDAYMKRTRYLDVIYAVICASLFGFVGGFVVGTKCVERFLSKCVAYKAYPLMFALGFFVAGTPFFWICFKSLRAERRRKRWFG